MLFRKMARDLWSHKGTYMSSMVLIIIGILVYNMYSIIYVSFDTSLDRYYEDYNFSHGVVKVAGMPKEITEDIGEIREVKDAVGRLEERVRMITEEKEVIFQMISYDADRENRVNDIQLIEGRMPDPDSLEIIMGNYFFEATNMALGDIVPVIVNGKRYNLEVVGYGRSPEFIYAVKSKNELIADPTGFDMVYMPYESMSDMFGLSKQINNVAFTLHDEETFDEVKPQIEEVVYKYGITELSKREEQVSHVTTRQKLDGIGGVTQSIPSVFLLISGIIIYIVLRRVIEQERTQIGVIKAMGISDMRILVHYISYAVLIGLIGAIIGSYIGISLVPIIIDMLAIGFNMPFETAGLYMGYIIRSMTLTIGFTVISGYAGAKNCVKLEPATAMRIPIAKESKAGIIDKFYFLVEGSDVKLRIALRNILRNKGRSVFILFGVIITAGLLTFPVALNNMYNKMLFDQFSKIEVYDMKISFNGYVERGPAVRELESKEGVTLVEPQMVIPVEFFNGWRSQESAIISLPLDSEQYHLFDIDENEVDLPSDGLVMSHWMAENLDLSEGDYVQVKSPLFREDTIKSVKVAKIIPQYVGSNGYMNIEQTKELLDGKDLVNALMVSGDEELLRRLTKAYDESDRIATFDFSADMYQQFTQFLEQTTTIIGILVLVGLFTGFAVIYVSLTISLSERNRELSTMLVMGMSDAEVHQVLMIEQFIISVFGIALGLPFGKLLLAAFAESTSTEYLIMPSIVPTEAMVFSVVATIVAIIIPQFIARRKIGKINVTEALNARE